jgi:hypothetical protein
MTSSTVTSSIPQERGMADIRRILCPTDFSEFSDIALSWLVRIGVEVGLKNA